MRILYTRTDGNLSIVHAAKKEDIEKVLGTLTQEEYEQHVWSRSVPADAINAVAISDDYVLPAREFRDAWAQDGAAVTHDLPKAKEIQLKRIRAAREPKFAQLDKEFMLALETGADTSKIIADKKVLRDATEALKNAEIESIEQLKGFYNE
jgi:hypothetical protein